LAFFSHKLSPTDSRYSTFDCELLAAFQAVKHFHFFLEWIPFTLFNDHKPLVAAVSKSITPFSSRKQRHLSFLSEFTTNFVHLSVKENIVADTLSRLLTSPPTYSAPPPPLPVNATLPISIFPIPLSYLDMAKAQSTCPSIPPLLQQSSLNITTVPLSPDLSLLGDVSTPTFHPLVPLPFLKQIFEHVQSLDHLGIRAPLPALIPFCLVSHGRRHCHIDP
jgi:hypothetical protein